MKTKSEKLVDEIVDGKESQAKETLREMIREKIVRKVKETLGEES